MDLDKQVEINVLSGMDTVLRYYQDKRVSVQLRHAPTVAIGTVHWVGSHLVELTNGTAERRSSQWMRIADVVVVTAAYQD